MATRKRKATDDITPVPSTRRSSGRVKKAEVKYEESDAGEQVSDAEFNEEPDEDEDEDVETVEPDEEYDSDASIDGTKTMRNWKKSGKSRGEIDIEIPGEKSNGGVPYEDERIHKNTMDFLKDLKKNNRRDWLKWHDKPFRQAERDFHSFVGEINSVMSEKDPTIPELPIKDIIFRIYRDIRFSPDPTPYKPYFSVAWSRTGRKGPYAHYYLHIQPNGGSFFGGGYYSGESATLTCLREDIDQQPHQFKSILTNPLMRRCFFPAAKNDEKKVVAAFCAMNAENALKTKPKGYDADHKDIALLKLKSFVVRKNISDAEIVAANSLDVIAGIVEAMEPFITYLNHVVMPDR